MLYELIIYYYKCKYYVMIGSIVVLYVKNYIEMCSRFVF